jgi:hypothetical protein
MVENYLSIYQFALDPGNSQYKGPVNQVNNVAREAFWSITMYDGRTRFLVDNPSDRYLINSAMLPDLVRDADGGITLYLHHESPGPDLESNWLPAPAGPMAVVMRLYLPKPEALSGAWTTPRIVARS